MLGGVHRTPLELMLRYQPSPLLPHAQLQFPLRSALWKENTKTCIPGQVHFCAIFVLFCENDRFFSFPNIPNDFLLKCKIMQRVFRKSGE